MLTITCPWCDELEQLPLADITDADPLFVCSACGTSVAIVEESMQLPELAPGWSRLAA
jgi:transcription elongation factor Elf1